MGVEATLHYKKAGGMGDIVGTVIRKHKLSHLVIVTCLFFQHYHWYYFVNFQNDSRASWYFTRFAVNL